MQYKILASDYDNTLVPFGESQPRPADPGQPSTGKASWAASGSTMPSPATVPASWTRTAPSWQNTP